MAANASVISLSHDIYKYGVLSSAPTVTISADNKTYDGSGITLTAVPSPAKILSYDIAYTYQWKKDNTDISGATSSTYTTSGDIAGSGSYSVKATTNSKEYSSAAKAVSITAADIKDFTMTISPETVSYDGTAKTPTVSYDGTAKTPTVTITNGGTPLIADTHYTLEFSNNTEAGTATVTATGKGNYTGTATKTFEIVKAEEDDNKGSGGEAASEPGTPQTAKDEAGNTVFSRQTVFTKSGTPVLSVDIAITASTDLTAVSGEKFSQNVSVDVTLDWA
ncbi:MAG: hypothetical protein IJR85_00810, partial [Synergistaceae bacterium]|nr:hypothetical protein [Synergistaceae bacterium]